MTLAEERIGNCERELAAVRRKLHCLVAFLIVILLALPIVILCRPSIAFAQRSSSIAAEVRAHNFTLVDGNGKTRMMLTSEANEPALVILDEESKPRALLAVTAEGASLMLTDKQGRPRIGIVGSDEGGTLSLHDDKSVRAGILVDKSGVQMVMADQTEKERVKLAVGDDGPIVALLDKTGNPRVSLSAAKEEPLLSLFDGDRKHRVWLHASGLFLFDNLSRERASLQTPRDGATLRLMHANGKLGATMVVDKGSAAVELADSSSERGISVGALQDTGAGLLVRDSDGVERVHITVSKNEPRAILSGPDGAAVWRAP